VRTEPLRSPTEDALTLLGAREGDELEALADLADALRAEAAGDEVTYVVTRNINFTNVCYTGCRFCAFAQRRTDADAYTLSLDAGSAPRKRGRSAPPRCACRAASTRTCRGRRTSTSRRR
jgi:FO synthase